MSIQSEINRISGNVADALAAIAEKGVTVPNGSNSDALAGLIAAIQAGGGGAEVLGHKVAYGSFTLTEDTTTTYTVLDKGQVFEAVKDDFPGLTSLSGQVYTKDNSSFHYSDFFLIAFCWRDISDLGKNAIININEWIAAIRPKDSLSSGNSALAYGDKYKAFGAKSGGSNGLKIGTTTGMTIGFGASYIGYAGTKYNWLIFPMDHGAVRED